MSNSHKGISTFKGKKHSEEAKKKISKAMKGNTPWNKGKKVCKQLRIKEINNLMRNVRFHQKGRNSNHIVYGKKLKIIVIKKDT